MRPWVHRAYRAIVMIGIDPVRTIHFFRGLPAYFRDLRALKRQRKASIRLFPFGHAYPCLGDRFADSGSARGHYFHQDLLAARRICTNNPQVHIDVGSRLDGFVAHVASFRPIVVIDIRPNPSQIPNVRFVQADFMSPLAQNLVESCDSASCLHVLEHFGLGRYGDPVNYDGYLPGLDNLHRILKPAGKLYFSVPIGPQRIEFNAHRVFSVAYLLECFSSKYRVDHFSFVDDRGDLHENVEPLEESVRRNFGCQYGCGILEMTKL